MKKIFGMIFLFMNVVFVYSQKIEIDKKTDIVTIDGVNSFILESQNMGNTIVLKSLLGERLANFQHESYNDSKKVSSGNPQGRVAYLSVTFMDEGLSKCEIPNPGLRKQMAKMIIENGLIKDGKLDDVSLRQYVAIHGTKFSDERNKSTTIIIVR